MTAFAAALAVLHNDANLSVLASIRALGLGAPVAARVIVSRPDADGTVFGGMVIRPDALITARIADYPCPAETDTITAAGVCYIVRHWRRDPLSLSWEIGASIAAAAP